MDGVGILPPPARGRGPACWEGANGIHRVHDNVMQSLCLHPAESRLPVVSKNLRNTPSLSLLDDIIQVHKRTAEQPREFPPDAALAASHKSHQRYYHLIF